MFSFFGNFIKLYGLSYMGKIAGIQIMFTLERKVKKDKGIKRHFSGT